MRRDHVTITVTQEVLPNGDPYYRAFAWDETDLCICRGVGFETRDQAIQYVKNWMSDVGISEQVIQAAEIQDV
jgi:hypothetical protein